MACLLLAGACGSDPPAPVPTATPTPIPTATPFAVLPQPTVVTGDEAPAQPAPEPSGNTTSYTVVAGDALSLIAERFNVTSAAIQALNNLPDSDIFIGQVLLIPAPDGSPDAGTPIPPSEAPGLPSPGAATSYTVQPGDTAYGIALQFDTTVEALEQANGVGPGGLDDLQLEQVLQIPPPGER